MIYKVQETFLLMKCWVSFGISWALVQQSKDFKVVKMTIDIIAPDDYTFSSKLEQICNDSTDMLHFMVKV
ncbi:hypothetical protein Gohar_024699 [Gossypium harknessii]|uniref:Uncharacterized protein n=1 Tax=Gossypium harknessii TaxID=34285 RepID=A0A7J9HGQ3_9ROSI|nr:hypothetical protein [Gossypium harknessii]